MKKKRSTEEPAVEDDGVILDDPDAGKSRRRGRGTGLGRYILIAILATTLVTAAGGLTMGWLQFVKQKEIADSALASEMARQHAHLVSAVVRQAQAQAQQLAAGELVSTAFAEDREAATAALLSQLILDGSVTLVPADSLQLASGLSFTAREMLLKARKGERPPPVFLPGEVPVLLMAEPAADGGVLLLEQRLNVLANLMQQQQLEGAWVTIKSADNQVIFSVGKSVEGQRGVIESSAGARAEAVVPPSAEDPALLMLYAIVSGGMILLVMLVIISTLMAVGRAIRKDSALLANLASDLTSHGQASTRDEFTFTPIELVTQSIRKLAEEGGAAGSTPARRKSADNAGDDDDSFIAVSGDNMAELTGDDEATVVMSQLGISVAEEIFREYDIRGVTGKTLTEEAAEAIGRAIGTESLQQGEGTVVLARDGRLSSPDISEAVARGLLASGRDVIDIGQVPTPVMYYATKVLNATSGVMITGSHNPPEYNGIKVVVAGETLHGDRIRALHTRIERNEFATGEGMRRSEDVLQRYLQEILADIVMARPMKIVVDTGNGVAGVAAPELFRQLGCEVEELFTDVDGTFPNHHPDTSKPENYAALIQRVQQGGAEIGLAFDGDGDRLGVVTPAGEIIWPDRLMMLYAKDLLTRSPGADVIFDVKCSRELNRLISAQGGRPVMARTGHSLIKAKLKETGAPLAGEMSGHIFFADRWHGFDDGMYAGARLLEILSLEAGNADEVFAGYATGPCTPEITIPVPDDVKFAVVQKLQSMADQFSGNATTIDGLRVDFDDGWGLVRASNTTPCLVARFEGADEAALQRIEEEFRNALQAISSNMKVPF